MDGVDWESLGLKMYRGRNLKSNLGATKAIVMAFPDDEDWMVMRLFNHWVKINARKFHQRYEVADIPATKN